jgi:prepilin-type N-terminal cleavage/methylation domain-containing protein
VPRLWCKYRQRCSDPVSGRIEHRSVMTSCRRPCRYPYLGTSDQQGFSLIEILAVMFIIAVAVAALQPNFSGDERLTQLKEEAGRWSVMLELLSQEAVLTGKDFGVAFHTNGAQIYIHEPLTLAEIEEMQQSLSEKKPRHEWRSYTTPPFKFLELPDNIRYSVKVEGQSAKIEPAFVPNIIEKKPEAKVEAKQAVAKAQPRGSVDPDKEPKPHLVFFSGGEQQSMELVFFWDGLTNDDPPDREFVVLGDGLGRFRVSDRHVEDF